jgi:uncharacterized protein
MSLIDVNKYKVIINNTIRKIEDNEENLNTLNVFPIPDGDTGSNVLLTFIGGKKYIENPTNGTLKELVSTFSKGLVLSSRGNSGTILSQYFRGFASEIKEDKDPPLSTTELINCLKSAYKYAYASISEPQEGTILSVMNSIFKLPEDNIVDLTKQLYTISCEELIKGIDRLDILRETGVVDSGGYAFLFFIEELYLALSPEPLSQKTDYIAEWSKKISQYTPANSVKYNQWKNNIIDSIDKNSGTGEYNMLDYTFCTEFFLNPSKDIDKSKLSNNLNKHGNSILLFEDGKRYKIHIHTNVPEKIMRLCERFGEISSVKIDNMYFQHQHYLQLTEKQSAYTLDSERNIENKETGTISVASSEGLAEVMYSLGIDKVVIATPTLTELISQICSIQAKSIIILPSSKKQYPVINEAVKLIYKHCSIIRSSSVPEVLSALIHYEPEETIEDNLNEMEKGLSQIKYAEIIDTNRLTHIPKHIKPYEFAGVNGKQLLSYGNSRSDIVKEITEKLIDDDISLITMYCGKNVSQDEVTHIKNTLESIYKDDIAIELIDTKQPESYFIVSLE